MGVPLIGFEDLCLAMIIVVLLLVVLSVPTLVLTVRNSSKLLRRYMLLRSLDNVGDAPVQIQREWDNIKSTIGYTTAVVEEIESLGSLRPTMFQVQVAAVLIAFLLMADLFGSYIATDVAVFLAFLLAICLLAMRYGSRNINKYLEEYSAVLKQLESNGGESFDNMYG